MAKFFTPTKLSEKIRETPEGYLLCLDVPIARTGWQQYGRGETPLEPGEDGFVWIYRDADEVFKPQTIASFNAKSITIKHPENWVAPDNWQELTHGIAQNIRRGEEKDEDGEEMLLADFLITEKMAIGLVLNGLREVSCGYDAEYEETGKGEGRQYNIVGNHIALVEAGRAGPTYAIKDHKGEYEMNEKLKKLLEQIKTLGKTVDEAVKLEDAKAKTKKTADAEEKKEDKEKAGDEEAASYDELMKAVKDLSDKVEALGGSKDDAEEKEEKSEDDSEEKKEEKSEDDDEKEASIEERLKALEAAVAKLLEMEQKESSEDEDSEEKEDAEDEDMAGAEDEDAEEKKEKKTGDAALAEILAPGVKATKGEDIKVKALKVAYATEEGKEVIESLTGGKKPTFDSKENVALLFNAASALLKQKRGNGLEGTKKATVKDSDKSTGPMTAEKLNEINAEFYSAKK